MWEAMRMLKCFRTRELLALCGFSNAARPNLTMFMARLLNAGYLRADGNRYQRVYTLLRDTGPQPQRFNQRGELAMDVNEEISRERQREVEILADLYKCRKRLKTLGAYVEQSDK